MKIIYAKFIGVCLIVFLAFSANAQCNVNFTVETTGGRTTIAACDGGMIDSYVRVIANIRGFPVYYILTDNNDVVLEYNNYPIFNLANSSGSRRIYGVLYMGRISAKVGQSIHDHDLGSFCFNLSSNFIAIEEAAGLEGGSVSFGANQTSTTICVGNGVSDYLDFNSTSSDTGYIYIITDNDGNILGSAEDGFDFDAAPPGICRVYGLSYTGIPSIIVGNSINGNLAAGCFERSDNYIEVNRVSLESGEITSNLGHEINFCNGDGLSDFLDVSLLGVTPGVSYVYILTGENDTVIQENALVDYDFEFQSNQRFRLYGVSYTGSLNLAMNENVRNFIFSDDCFAVTENYISINNNTPDAGTILFGDSTMTKTTCPGDGLADSLSFYSEMNSGHDMTYVITDANGLVLTHTSNNYFDFEGAPAGTCYIYGLSYTGNLSINPGDTAATAKLSDACFVLSKNSIEVNRVIPSLDSIFLSDGSQSAEVCVGDGLFDFLNFSVDKYTGQLVYLITDDNGDLIGVNVDGIQNFEGAPAGICRIYGLAFTGNIAVEPGDHILTNDVTDGCFELSDNYIQVNRNEIDPGVISSPLGDTISVCPMDGNPDLVPLVFTTASAKYAYIITDENLMVLALPATDTIDFDGAPEGICYIHGVSYTGDLNVMVGETIDDQSLLATGCFALSNHLVVYRFNPQSTNITAEGATLDTIDVCVGDGMSDVVTFNYVSSQPQVRFVITDENDFVLAILDNNEFDFDGVVPGVCHTYGLSYAGNFTGVTGEHLNDVVFSDDCFALSNNHITINRNLSNGGEVMTREGSDAAYVCPGDMIEDIVYFSSNGASGDNFIFVITNEFDSVIAMTTADSFNFENIAVDQAKVYGLAYNGMLLLNLGDYLGTDMATGCHHVSDSYINIFIGKSIAGTIETIDGLTSITVDKNDTISDVVFFRAIDAPTYPDFRYVICDQMNRVVVILATNGANFAVAPNGSYRVYYIAFTGTLNLVGGNDILNTVLSDGCYSISENYVEVELIGTTAFDSQGWLSNQLDFTAFPNPAIDIVNVELSMGVDVYPKQNIILRLYDNKGHLVKNWSENNQDYTGKIDVSNLPNGRYMLSIQTGQNETNKPILILR